MWILNEFLLLSKYTSFLKVVSSLLVETALADRRPKEVGVGGAFWECRCARETRRPTWVGVQLALHGFADALQLHGLQGFVHVHDGRQAAQRVLDQVGHLPDVEELQQLRVHGWEGAQKHRLERMTCKSTPRQAPRNRLRTVSAWKSETSISKWQENECQVFLVPKATRRTLKEEVQQTRTIC